MCQAAGLDHAPRRVLSELGHLQIMDVVIPSRQDFEIRRRFISTPGDHQQILLDHLKLRLPKPRHSEM